MILTGIFSAPFNAGIYRFTYRINGIAPCISDESEAIIRYGNFEPVDDMQVTTCFGESLNLDSLYNLVGYTIIKNWSFNGIPVTDPANVSDAGTYELILGDGGSCTDTLKVRLTQRPPVVAAASGDSIAVQNVLFGINATGEIIFGPGYLQMQWFQMHRFQTLRSGSQTRNIRFTWK